MFYSPSAVQTHHGNNIAPIFDLYKSENIITKRDRSTFSQETSESEGEDRCKRYKTNVEILKPSTTCLEPVLAIQNNFNKGFQMWKCVELFQQYITTDINNLILHGDDLNVQLGLQPRMRPPCGLSRLQHDLGFQTTLNFDYLYFLFNIQYIKKGTIKNTMIHRGEWTEYLFKIECDTLEQLHYYIKSSAMHGMKNWTVEQKKNFFTFMFKYVIGPNQTRYIDTTMAAKLLCNVVALTTCPKMSRFSICFANFLFKNVSVHKCINLDQWKVFVDFSTFINEDCSNFDSNDAWPIIYDDFVEWMQKGKSDRMVCM
ncbi:RALGPS1 [Acrasis kona]|uniref:Defective in cullin neddylation protein n=1 Tax=Acrasis kona TaxID=1008807 RepID=A0AAW2Z6S9_9EUKA